MPQNLTNWDRQYRVTVGKSKQEGFEVGEPTQACPIPLHCTFSIEKSDTTTCNTATLDLWNLSPEHLEALAQKDCACTLRAGYGNKLGLIFTGIVSHATTSMDNSDRKTEIELVDNLTQIRDTYVSVSYAGKVSWRTILDDIASQMGVAITYSYNATFADVENGYSYVGKAREILDKGCACCGLSWSLQSGVLQVKVPGDTMTREVYLLTPETGLLGIPEQVVVEEDTDSGQKVMGWDVQYFLNAAINVDDFVRVESKTVTGYFRVYSVSIDGDSAGGDWACKARLLEIRLSGENPAQDIYTLQEKKNSSGTGSTDSETGSKDTDGTDGEDQGEAGKTATESVSGAGEYKYTPSAIGRPYRRF